MVFIAHNKSKSKTVFKNTKKSQAAKGRKDVHTTAISTMFGTSTYTYQFQPINNDSCKQNKTARYYLGVERVGSDQADKVLANRQI